MESVYGKIIGKNTKKVACNRKKSATFWAFKFCKSGTKTPKSDVKQGKSDTFWSVFGRWYTFRLLSWHTFGFHFLRGDVKNEAKNARKHKKSANFGGN